MALLWELCLAGTMTTTTFNQSRVALHFAHRRGSVRCICSRCGGLRAFGGDLGSDAGLVAVEGRDVEHVAVCADSDGLHLAITGQRCRMGGAARAEDLATTSTVMLSADDSEGSFAGNAGVAGFIGHPVWRIFELALPGLGCQF